MIKDKFRKYLEEAIGQENARIAFSAFDSPASVSLRLNPFKPCSLYAGRPVPWNRYGLILEERPKFTLDPYFHAGAYYVQDSSSMFVGHVFRHFLQDFRCSHDRPVRVLDMCAAPGGKTTDLAASLREAFDDGFILVSNEIMKSRVGILADNAALWGDPNVVVTSDDPRAFAALGGFFDIIVADVPCSGEGMFRKDASAQEQWSEDNVALCQARQRRIVADVWDSLAPGGLFIYSTCTFNRYENDDNVRWIESELGAECLLVEDVIGRDHGILKTDCGYSLVPGLVEGEGQYCSALRKNALSEVFEKSRSRADRGMDERLPQSLAQFLSCPAVLRRRGDMLTAVPSVIASEVSVMERYMHLIAAGCALGTMKGNTFVPDADLALSAAFNREVFPEAELNLQSALAFLHKDTLMLPDRERGFLTVTYGDLPLGFVKNLGNRCNNLHPQSRRIRMNIK